MSQSFNWTSSSTSTDPAFVSLACTWMNNPSHYLLGFVWSAYDAMCASKPPIDDRDLERSITSLLEPRINNELTGDEPFYIQHSPFERETMAAQPAQPPAYDLAFVFRTDERIMWPMEAKVLATPKALADYIRDIRDQFLNCRYAPFSTSAAMLAYLLSGSSNEALIQIASQLGTTLKTVPEFPARAHRVSNHIRNVPVGKTYSKEFDCHHLIFEFIGLQRRKR